MSGELRGRWTTGMAIGAALDQEDEVSSLADNEKEDFCRIMVYIKPIINRWLLTVFQNNLSCQKIPAIKQVLQSFLMPAFTC